MKDKVGMPIEVGDIVIYAKMKGDELHLAKVDEILDENYVHVRNLKTNRLSINPRHGSQLLNITLIKEAYPEYFI